MGVVDSIFEHARTTPDRTALIHNGHALTYRQFAARIVVARRFLATREFRRDRVAVLCINSAPHGWIVGLALRGLGVTTAPGRSIEDIAQLGLGPVSLVSSATETWPGLAETAARIGAPLALTPRDLYVGADAVEIGPDERAAAPAGGQVLLTSGTTGVYKKVLFDAAGEARNRDQRAELYGLNADSVACIFDLGGWTSVGYHVPVCAWGLGATAVIHQGPERWRALSAPRLTHAFGQPQLLADLLATPPEIPLRNDAVTLIITAGALSLDQWRAARERLTLDVRTCIGSTETGGFTLTRIETPQDLRWHQAHPASQVEVVDADGRPAPVGTSGVLRVRTIDADGYLADPATSAAFFRDGYFYPGDLAVLREDGRLALDGRITDVINVMGDKIATAPIETLLQDRLGAAGVCVFSAADEGGEAVHVAIQFARPAAPADIRAALIAALPGVAEVCLHTVAAFPRNHMGKIERAALKRQLLAGSPG